MEDVLYHVENAILRRGSVADGFAIHVSELRLAPAELVAVLGSSGCGKSTLLDALGLVLRPAAADIFEMNFGDGRSFSALHRQDEGKLLKIRRRHLGYILQSGGLIASMSVRENILTAVHFSEGRLNRDRFSTLIEKLGLAPLLQRRPRDLSGGQRQRVAIARALVHGPKLVLADEPTAAIDHRLTQEVCDTLRSCAKDLGSAVVMVTHNRDLATTFADRTINLEDGTHSPVSRL